MSKSQLKAIVGGVKAIECTITVTYPGGEQISNSGACSGSTVAACTTSIEQNCANFPGRETCAFSCYETGGPNPE